MANPQISVLEVNSAQNRAKEEPNRANSAQNRAKEEPNRVNSAQNRANERAKQSKFSAKQG